MHTFFFSVLEVNYLCNKKVLLRERKRHTAHHVASARYAALSPDEGGGTLDGGGVYPIPGLDWGGEGYPVQSWMGVSYPRSGLGGGGYPIQSWMGWYPIPGLVGGVPHTVLDWGYPPPWTWDGVHPPPSAGWGTPTWTWDGVPLSAGWVPPLPGSGMGTPSAGWGTPSPESWTDTHL